MTPTKTPGMNESAGTGNGPINPGTRMTPGGMPTPMTMPTPMGMMPMGMMPMPMSPMSMMGGMGSMGTMGGMGPVGMMAPMMGTMNPFGMNGMMNGMPMGGMPMNTMPMNTVAGTGMPMMWMPMHAPTMNMPMTANAPWREFLAIPYEMLEEMNLKAKADRLSGVSPNEIAETRMRTLADEKRIKAVTVCFTDLEGRLHMLDYDKKHLLKSWDNLTFDGSSVHGFTSQAESDLRLGIDWTSFYWLPCDVFGPGKVLVFGEVMERDGSPFPCDLRTTLKTYLRNLHAKEQMTVHVAPEIEGFLFRGADAERWYPVNGRFDLVSSGGYYHSLPGDTLRLFIDRAAEAQRAMGFENEKDHPEVAPSQFEMNFCHTDALVAADQIQLYKLLCRQVAAQQGMTASFLPKPMTGVNGNGMHLNLSIARHGKNLFHDRNGQDGLSTMGWDFIDRILTNASDLCLALNSSVNAYRRLDPHYEAPNQIKASANDRGSMIRIPMGNEKTARVEVRSVAPDANPYLALYLLVRTGLEGPRSGTDRHMMSDRNQMLPGNILDAMTPFMQSPMITRMLGETAQEKYVMLKRMTCDRCPKELGAQIKVPEIQFHHEVTNQHLWSQF